MIFRPFRAIFPIRMPFHLDRSKTDKIPSKAVIIQCINNSTISQSGKFVLKNGEAIIQWKKTSLKERLSKYKFPRKHFRSLRIINHNLQEDLKKYCYIQYYNSLYNENAAPPPIFIQRVAKHLPKQAQDQLLKHILHEGFSGSIVSKEDLFAHDPIFQGPKDIEPAFVTRTNVDWNILHIANHYKNHTDIPFNLLKYLAEVCLMTRKPADLKDFNQQLGAHIAEFLFFRNPPGVLSNWTILYSNGPEPITKEESFILPILKTYLIGSPDGSIAINPTKVFKKLLQILTHHFNPKRPYTACNIRHAIWESLFSMLPHKEPFTPLLGAYYDKRTTPTSFALLAQELKQKAEKDNDPEGLFIHSTTPFSHSINVVLKQLPFIKKIHLINEFYTTEEGRQHLEAPVEITTLGILKHLTNLGDIFNKEDTHSDAFNQAFMEFLKNKNVL